MLDGSEEAFRAWVALRREPLRRSVFLMCGDWFLADDVVQEALTRLFAVWGRVAGRGDPEAYTRRIAVNLLIDHRRRPSRREVPQDDLPDLAAPDTEVSGREALADALGKLPPRQRATLVLRFWEGLSVEETANILNCSTGTVKSNTSKGLGHLRTTLGAVRTESSKGTDRE